MSLSLIVITIIAYLVMLFALSYRAGAKSDNAGFFIGNRTTSWWKATLAMIGAAMSGVTFISVPGSVAVDSFSYMQMVVGFTIGQLIVAFVLIPLFYRQGVVSLYQYLDSRFDITTHRVGAWCFLIAKIVASSLKVYIVCSVMQLLIFDTLGIPFIINVIVTMLFVWLYTHRGGVRSLIPTDILQSVALVSALLFTIYALCRAMDLSFVEGYQAVVDSPYSKIWFFDDASSPRYFWKMIVGGILVLVAMTGLDQDLMQRNMSCRTMRDSQINICLTALCQALVILLFLSMGVLLYRYVDFASLATPAKGDDIFAMVAVQGGLPIVVGILFILGLISSTYSAAGSALTSLTTSFTLDILSGKEREEQHLRALRRGVHLVMAIVMAAAVLLFESINNDGVINLVFRIAGYTYGPILGLFTFGILTRREVKGRYVPYIAIAAPILSWLLQWGVAKYMNYVIGFELLGYNALIVIFGLILCSRRADK